MTDVVTKAVRSKMMAGIKGKDTKPEILVRRLLFAEGFRFRLHRKDLAGAPDIVLPKYGVAIFVHGCFWHAHAECRFYRLPSSNANFWRTKLMRNVERDKNANAELLKTGWRVLTVWECATKGPVEAELLGRKLSRWIVGNRRAGEIRGPS